MPAAAPAPGPRATPDRRHRRHQQTIEEILDVAVEVMAEEGAGGLSLGEVARRIGVRTPSLYGYFDSKHALYDAVFQRGWSLALEVVAAHEHRSASSADPAADMLARAQDFVRWALDNPAYAQLMFWRPVPGFEPSQRAYAPAVELLGRTTSALAGLRDAGVLRDDVEPADVAGVWTSLVSGVISQQLSNAPGESFEQGSFTRLLPQLVAMFLSYYGPAVHAYGPAVHASGPAADALGTVSPEGRSDGGSGGTRARPRPSGDRPSPGGRAGRDPAPRAGGSARAT